MLKRVDKFENPKDIINSKENFDININIINNKISNMEKKINDNQERIEKLESDISNLKMFKSVEGGSSTVVIKKDNNNNHNNNEINNINNHNEVNNINSINNHNEINIINSQSNKSSSNKMFTDNIAQSGISMEHKIIDEDKKKEENKDENKDEKNQKYVPRANLPVAVPEPGETIDENLLNSKDYEIDEDEI